jgi:hypothetical protein
MEPAEVHLLVEGQDYSLCFCPGRKANSLMRMDDGTG